MKIGIIGGTFNPIHVGHLALGKAVLDRFDMIWYMTAGVSYLKLSSCFLSGQERHNMVLAALKDIDCSKFEANSLEIERTGDSYTYETVAYLKEKYSEDEFTFIYGSDCIFHIDKWKEAAYLFKNTSFLFACRTTDDYSAVLAKKEELEQKYQINCEILNVSLPDVSSTHIRENRRHDISIDSYVTPSVYEIIMEKGYYHETD